MGTFGAMAGVKGRRARFCIKFVGLASIVVLTAPVSAQEPGDARAAVAQVAPSAKAPALNRAPGGATDRPSSSDNIGAPNGLATWFLPYFIPSTSSEVLEDLFKEALSALDEGRSDEAQTLLEKVIAEAPGSAMAAKARRHLAILYTRGDGTGSVEIVASAIADASNPKLSATSERASRPPSSRPFNPHAVLARWGGKNVSPHLEEQFVLVAGDRVFFNAGSAELGVRARAVLEAQAKFMAVRQELAAIIEGHADDGMTSAEDEVKLSRARAEVVRDGLVAEGISPDRLIVIARGRESPASACPEPACAAQNRRAITVLMTTAALKIIRNAQSAADAPASNARKLPETQ